jgi:hypothetical protein
MTAKVDSMMVDGKSLLEEVTTKEGTAAGWFESEGDHV